MGEGLPIFSSSKNLRWGEGDPEFIGRRIEPAPRLAGDEVVKGQVFRDALKKVNSRDKGSS